jgi:hypothetical protein
MAAADRSKSSTRLEVPRSKNAAAAGAARVGQQFLPGVGMQQEKLVNEAIDLLRKNSVPMTEAMKRTFLTGQRVEFQNFCHRFQGGEMESLPIRQDWTAIHRHGVPPHVADRIERRSSRLVTVRQVWRAPHEQQLTKERPLDRTHPSRTARGTEGSSRQRMCSPGRAVPKRGLVAPIPFRALGWMVENTPSSQNSDDQYLDAPFHSGRHPHPPLRWTGRDFGWSNFTGAERPRVSVGRIRAAHATIGKPQFRSNDPIWEWSFQY